MKKSEFEAIINDLNDTITFCKKEYKVFPDTEYINSLTINKYNHLVSISRVQQAKMDKYISDFYHLVGMGNLNCCQISTLSKTFKEYISYRSFIKYYAMKSPFDCKGTLKDNSEYNLTCGIKLMSKNNISNN